MKRLLFIVVVLLFSQAAAGQTQWRFPIAFEDGTGARDTIWLVWDTGASQGSDSNPLVDEQLGEGAVDMDLNAFNVWIYNWALDSTKTFALPYAYFPAHGVEIRAFNYQFPVRLEWDTALFRTDLLPNPAAIQNARMDSNHFFSFNNDPPLQAYNMLLDDSVSVELMFPNDALFPLLVTIYGDAHASQHEDALLDLGLFPNPALDGVAWTAHEPMKELRIRDACGHQVSRPLLDPALDWIDVRGLPAGPYILEGIGQSSSRYHAKFLKLRE